MWFCRRSTKKLQNSGAFSWLNFENVVAEVYPSMSATSLHVCMNRIVSWLRFTGQVEIESPDLLIRPIAEGKEFGSVVIRHPQLIDGKAVFFCSSGPSRVINLATELCYKKSLTRKDIEDNASRNAGNRTLLRWAWLNGLTNRFARLTRSLRVQKRMPRI